MLGSIIGKRIVDFKDKKTNEQVKFTELHVLSLDKDFVGKKATIIKTKMPDAEHVDVPGDYNIYFDQDSKGMARLALIQKVAK